jgi:hypothetical protein
MNKITRMSNANLQIDNKQAAFDEKIKGTLMWGISQQKKPGANEKQDLSKGLGLAILSKVLGVQTIESKY